MLETLRPTKALLLFLDMKKHSLVITQLVKTECDRAKKDGEPAAVRNHSGHLDRGRKAQKTFHSRKRKHTARRESKYLCVFNAFFTVAKASII